MVWYHVAGVYNGNSLMIYVNGASEGTNTIGSVIPYTGNAPLILGTLAFTTHGPEFKGYYHGLIDEVRIWNEALTDLPSPLPVKIDIKPGSDPNPINQGSQGVIPVAILSAACFDATNVEPTSVSLGGATVAVRGKGKPMAHEEDVDADGLVDLVVQVETESLGEVGEDGIVTLTGETSDGMKIVGTDVVVIVPPK